MMRPRRLGMFLESPGGNCIELSRASGREGVRSSSESGCLHACIHRFELGAQLIELHFLRRTGLVHQLLVGLNIEKDRVHAAVLFDEDGSMAYRLQDDAETVLRFGGIEGLS